MIYTAGKMRLQELRIVRESPINDILICSCPDSEEGTMYTVLKVKQHSIAKNMLMAFEKSGLSMDDVCIDHFDYDGKLFFVFPDRVQRPLESFYRGETYSLEACEKVCTNLILTCITSGLPPAILYLILRQGQVNISKDDSIYLGYQIDLTDLDGSRTERDCAAVCAGIILKLLESKASLKAVSYELISKKSAKNSYHKFTELYKDVSIAASTKKKKNIRGLIRAFFLRNKDRFFRILLVISVVLVIIVLFSFLSHVIFGDVIWLRLFFNGFKVVGTQRLDIR